MYEVSKAYEKGLLEAELEREKNYLGKDKANYTTSAILAASLTTTCSVVAGSNPGSIGAGFLMVFGGISGVFALSSLYFGYKKKKEHKKIISELEKKLECL